MQRWPIRSLQAILGADRPGDAGGTRGFPEEAPHVGGRRRAHAGPPRRPQPLVLRRAGRGRGGAELRAGGTGGARAGAAGARPPPALAGGCPTRLRGVAVRVPVHLPLCPPAPSALVALGTGGRYFGPCAVRALA